jgi:hypothetical protein
VPWSFDIKTGVPPQAYTAPIEQPIPVTANIQCPPSKTPAVGAA